MGKLSEEINLVNYGNFITRAGRLDFPNGLIENGETLVKESQLSLEKKTLYRN